MGEWRAERWSVTGFESGQAVRVRFLVVILSARYCEGRKPTKRRRSFGAAFPEIDHPLIITPRFTILGILLLR